MQLAVRDEVDWGAGGERQLTLDIILQISLRKIPKA